ncbi:antitoxin [Spartinivicinus poritis]|uniref:Type II toxin-antitoxin system VapB family antitoxin n=1 Tax=Spartinivicinus poritis TaxID=2994640 RepID=A0ABT5UGB3_9GAMM|nr:type II toxin-antitoxin system VapB family antitoxin [Spartinivicinus sp. A2-2]MDE1465423.1 type II toxin-antitoxin system VapB family antitoxin [Spartinivicinus sp. A2-2]
MSLTKVFKSGNSQAVRIPAELQYDRLDMDYEIERVGDELRIRPARRRLTNLMEKFQGFSDDFMTQGRGDELDEPERDML